MKTSLEQRQDAPTSVRVFRRRIGIGFSRRQRGIRRIFRRPTRIASPRRIRALPSVRKTIPIIAMSGNVLEHRKRSFLDAGMNEPIGKPIERAKLYAGGRRWTSKNQDHDAVVTFD